MSVRRVLFRLGGTTARRIQGPHTAWVCLQRCLWGYITKTVTAASSRLCPHHAGRRGALGVVSMRADFRACRCVCCVLQLPVPWPFHWEQAMMKVRLQPALVPAIDSLQLVLRWWVISFPDLSSITARRPMKTFHYNSAAAYAAATCTPRHGKSEER